MPRANRYFLEGCAWHITHRCHCKEFLLKFAKDRKRWLFWLFEARKRFGLCVLNYMVTSNHIHLLLLDRGGGEIARSMQLIAGRTAQEYNRRKRRQGAYWQDRYHATAVDTDNHLARCMVYIDLNMVRAGVVDHPRQWQTCGYRELQNPPARYRILDRSALMDLLNVRDPDELQRMHRGWIEQALRDEPSRRDGRWSESLAVGSRDFVARVQGELGIRTLHRDIRHDDDMCLLREASPAYGAYSGAEKAPLRAQNTMLLDASS